MNVATCTFLGGAGGITQSLGLCFLWHLMRAPSTERPGFFRYGPYVHVAISIPTGPE
jgi:hypothetical protein